MDYDYDYEYDYEYTRNNVPAFGSWDCNIDLPFTQCFESARQAGFLGYSYYQTRNSYDKNAVTPTMIVVPSQTEKARYAQVKEGKKDTLVVCDYEYDYNYNLDVKEPPSPISIATLPLSEQPRRHVKPKAVDEDLYKISPEVLRVTRRRKKWWLFASCMQPTRVM